MSRLTPRQVLSIRELFDAGYSIEALAQAFDRHRSTIACVVHRTSYTRVRETASQLPIPRKESLKELVDRDMKEHGTAAHRFRGPNAAARMDRNRRS